MAPRAGCERDQTDHRWRARYRDAEGREHAKHFERKVDGQRWLDEVTAAVVTGQYVDPKAGRLTFRDYAEQWRQIQQHRPGTARLYERVLRLHVYPVLGDRRLGTIKHSDAVAFVSKVAGKVAPNTTRQVHAITRTIFRSAVHDRLISSSPISAIKLPAVQRGKVDPPTLGQFREVAAACGASAETALVTAAAGTGLRAGELLGLRWTGSTSCAVRSRSTASSSTSRGSRSSSARRRRRRAPGSYRFRSSSPTRWRHT